VQVLVVVAHTLHNVVWYVLGAEVCVDEVHVLLETTALTKAKVRQWWGFIQGVAAVSPSFVVAVDSAK
jgi:hypothetical protein